MTLIGNIHKMEIYTKLWMITNSARK